MEAGCNFFDTAPDYGGGQSEELLGEGLKSVRRDVLICTKFGHTAEGITDFSASAIRPSIEDSLRRLQTGSYTRRSSRRSTSCGKAKS